MDRTVLVLGKGTLAIRIADWFWRADGWRLVGVVPVVPEPAWTRSLSRWAERRDIPVVASGRAEDGSPLGPGAATRSGVLFDLAFSVYYDRILRPVFLATAARTLNLHNGPLPRYRGVAPINWALANGERHHGVTIHEVTPGIDDGPIVAQTTFSIHPGVDEVIDVYRRALDFGWLTFRHAIDSLDRIAATPQAGDASYYTRQDAERLGDRRSFTIAESNGGAPPPQRIRA